MKTPVLFLFSMLMLSLSANAQWTRMNVPHHDSSYIINMRTVSRNCMWANPAYPKPYGANYSKDILRTIDGGKSWKYDSISILPGYAINDLFPINKDTCYALLFNAKAGSGGTVVKTTDGGKSWIQCGAGTIFGPGSFPDNIYFWNENEGIAIGDPHPGYEIYKTYDGGKTWDTIPASKIPAPLTKEYAEGSHYAVSGNHIWFKALNGDSASSKVVRVFHSEDRGRNWTVSTVADSVKAKFDSVFFVSVAPHGFNNMTFTDSLHGFLSNREYMLNKPFGQANVFYRTDDGGVTWHLNVPEIDSFNPHSGLYKGSFFPMYITYIPGTHTLVSTSNLEASGRGTSYSNDYGRTWILIDSGSNALHTYCSFLSDSVGWSGEYMLSSKDSGGIFKWKGNRLSPVNDLPGLKAVVSIFPNPAAEVFYLKMLNGGNQDVFISITDMAGKNVYSFSTKETGEFFLKQIDTRSFAKGIYSLSIWCGKGHYMHKIIVD